MPFIYFAYMTESIRSVSVITVSEAPKQSHHAVPSGWSPYTLQIGVRLPAPFRSTFHMHTTHYRAVAATSFEK